MMTTSVWAKECPALIMAFDNEGTIVEMNNHAAEHYAKDGGYDLIGKNIYECHPEPARAKLLGLVNSKRPCHYTTERNGVKNMVCLMPWFCDGQHAGLVQIEFEIPFDLPHYNRDQKTAK